MKPNDPNAGRCRDCRFWWAEWAGDVEPYVLMQSECRRASPRKQQYGSAWERTGEDDGCGEFAPVPMPMKDMKF